MTQTKPIIVAVDTGYGDIKAVNNQGGKMIFPAWVGGPIPLDLNEVFKAQNNDSADHLHVKITFKDGNTLEAFAGKLAIKESPDPTQLFDTTRSSHTYFKVFPAIPMALLGMGEPFAAGVGLPLSDWKNKEQKTTAIKAYDDLNGATVKFLAGKHAGQSYKLIIEKTYIYPQAVGATFAEINHPNPPFEIIPGMQIGLIDMGFRTLDLVAVELGEDGPEITNRLSTTIELGVVDLYRNYRREFERIYGVKVDERRMERQITTGKAIVKGKEEDITPILESLKNSLVIQVVDKVKALWGNDIEYFQKIIFSGGGANVFYEQIKGSLNGLYRSREPQWDNANGYRNLVEALHG